VWVVIVPVRISIVYHKMFVRERKKLNIIYAHCIVTLCMHFLLCLHVC